MTPIADMVEQMIAGGVPAETIILAVKTAELAASHSTGIPVDQMAEKRRAYDRERKRNKKLSGGNPVESGRIPKEALTLLEDNNKPKKVRARKHPLPVEWQPNENHYRKATELHIAKSAVLSKAEDMRLWAQSSGAVKADWDATFHGFLRRDANKIATPPLTGTHPKVSEKSGFYADFNSPELDAWDAYHRKSKGLNAPRDKRGGFYFPTQWPPGYQEECAA